MNKLIKLVGLAIIVTAATSLQACNQKKCKVSFTTKFIEEKDSIPRNAIPDSVMLLLFEADAVNVTLLKDTTDSVFIPEKTIRLNKEQIGALKFAFMLSEIKSATALPFNRFTPQVSYLFKRKNESFSVQVDFGLGQLKVIKNNQISSYFLSDKILLTEAVMLFPDDEFLKYVLNYGENE